MAEQLTQAGEPREHAAASSAGGFAGGVRIYGFINGKWGHDDYNVGALGEDGQYLASHMSSSASWGKVDLMRKSDIYDAAYGAGGWVFEWVDDPKTHVGFLAAVERCKAAQAGGAANG